ncbi:hypothetical protein [Streptomyces agglomeratus]|uniref:hypothetical protein n=1 Tax=Streptomyces agglomeratus TaxID=285458 RepID=UPI00114CE617|nr:hypothetical protein [Streptomyces agglomeratus]
MREFVRHGLRWFLPAAAACCALLMEELSRLLSVLSAPGAVPTRAYDAGALIGWPGFNFADGDAQDAIGAWSRGAAAIGEHNRVLAWLWIFIVLYAVVMTIAIGGLKKALHALWEYLYEKKSEVVHNPPCDFKWPRRVATALTYLVCVESVVIGVLVDGLPKSPNGVLGGIAAVLSLTKWLLASFLVLLGVLVVVVDVFPVKLNDWLSDWRHHRPAKSRVWTRHRTQFGVVIVLALLVAVPAGGPLEQIPDIERSWAASNDVFGDVAGPLVSLIFLCLALWVAGRWALLDGVSPKRKESSSLKLLATTGVVIFLVAVMLKSLDWANWGVFAIPALIAGVAILHFPAQARLRESDRPNDLLRPTYKDRKRVRAIGRVLSVTPIALTSLSLVRAFAGPLLLAGIDSSHKLPKSAVAWFSLGLLVALVGSPLASWIVSWFEKVVLHDEEVDNIPERSEDRHQRVWLPNILGVTLCIVFVVLAVLLAVDPLKWGLKLRSLGLVSLVLASLTMLGGWFGRRAEAKLPFPTFGYLLFRHTPFWVLVVTAFLLRSMFDNSGGYHAVRLSTPPSDSSSESSPGLTTEFNSRKYFEAWLHESSRCLGSRYSKREGQVARRQPGAALPMVFIAASGGGIRAAYWSGMAMDRITDKRCAGSSLFGLSGVSGGSLGIVGHLVGQDGRKMGSNRGRDVAKELAGEDALAASLAAAFYHDLPHAVHGVDRIRDWRLSDRASALERAWERKNPRLAEDFFAATQPVPKPGAWRPLVMLNGTDASSGCRVLISQFWGTGKPREKSKSTLSCRKPAIAAAQGGRGPDRSGFAVAAIDAAAFMDSSDCKQNQSLRISTAIHLSARFAYISPSGTMYRCTHKETIPDSMIGDIDGGYLENSGLALSLQLWSTVSPLVAKHNQEVSQEGKGRYIVPVIALLDSHYSSNAAEPRSKLESQLTAPAAGRGASQSATRTATLEQAAIMQFSGPLPGLDLEASLHVGKHPCSSVRSFRVAPTQRPGMAAPLGWVLSSMSMKSLDNQMDTLVASDVGRNCASRPVRNDRQESESLAGLLALLQGPLEVRP